MQCIDGACHILPPLTKRGAQPLVMPRQPTI
jgi:hypothetical protein